MSELKQDDKLTKKQMKAAKKAAASIRPDLCRDVPCAAFVALYGNVRHFKLLPELSVQCL